MTSALGLSKSDVEVPSNPLDQFPSYPAGPTPGPDEATAGEPRTNPYSEAWLAANHGRYDNTWTAEYEARLQMQKGQNPVLAPFDALLQYIPEYGVDVRMSNAGFGGAQNEFQIDIKPTNSVFAIAGSNDGRAAGVGIYRTINGGSTWTAIDAPRDYRLLRSGGGLFR